MKRISVFVMLLFLCGCGTTVDYTYKNDRITPVIAARQCSTFGIMTVDNNNIPGLNNVIAKDLLKYFGPSMKIIDISNEHGHHCENEMTYIDGVKEKYPDLQLLFVVTQDVPEIYRTHYFKTEKENAYRDGKMVEIEQRYEVFRTEYSIWCDILLYDIRECTLLAKDSENFSQEKQFAEKLRENCNLFPSHTLLGQIEIVYDVLQAIAALKGYEEPDLTAYPEIFHLSPYTFTNYCYSFLEQLNEEGGQTVQSRDIPFDQNR